MYKGVRKIFRRYWDAYGGWSSLWKSPYFHLALLLTCLTTHSWLEKEWWETVIGTLPNLLGFTLAGFSMFIGFGDEQFRSMLAEPDEDENEEFTIYLRLCSTFVHFIVVQIIALLFAIVAKSTFFYAEWLGGLQPYVVALRVVGWCFGYILFLYALTSALAATMHVFRIASMYEQYRKSVKSAEDCCKKQKCK
jgi:hypothetical protein